jgi:hypothetical protein
MKTSVVLWSLLVLTLVPGFAMAQCGQTIVVQTVMCGCTGEELTTDACQGEGRRCETRFNAFFCDSGQICGVGSADRFCLGNGAASKTATRDLASLIPTCGGEPLFSPRKWVDFDLQDKRSIASTSRKNTTEGTAF